METNLVVKYQLFLERVLSMEQASSMIFHLAHQLCAVWYNGKHVMVDSCMPLKLICFWNSIPVYYMVLCILINDHLWNTGVVVQLFACLYALICSLISPMEAFVHRTILDNFFRVSTSDLPNGEQDRFRFLLLFFNHIRVFRNCFSALIFLSDGIVVTGCHVTCLHMMCRNFVYIT